MLQITIPAIEVYDESIEEFVTITAEAQTLKLEHSLVSLAKWESKWCKPFLTDQEKTYEETIDYIKCMTLTQNVKPEVYNYLTPANIEAVHKYIEAPMTATTFSETPKGKANKEIITAEIIYYWMVSLNIPPEYQKWHLNRLITLIRVINAKNEPPKKRSKRETINRYAALNEERRRKLKSKG